MLILVMFSSLIILPLWMGATYSRAVDGVSDANSNFDYLMLTLIYPEAVCKADDDAVPDSCEIPEGTPKWTVHGLWPNYNNGRYPQFCPGHPKIFDIDGIKDIVEVLKINWPNLYPDKSADSFWKHEWEKHGTCAQIDPKLDSELKYFNATLSLHDLLDVEKALHSQGIMPSEDPYTFFQMRQALTAGLTGGKRLQFTCLTDKKTKQTLLGDLRICVDKELQVMNCPQESYVRTASKPSPHLPSFRPCGDQIVYMPSKSEYKLEKLSEAFLQVAPGPMVLTLLAPVIAISSAFVLLFIILKVLTSANLELINGMGRTPEFTRVREALGLRKRQVFTETLSRSM